MEFLQRENKSLCDRLDALSTKNSMLRIEIFEQRDVVLIRVEELNAALDA